MGVAQTQPAKLAAFEGHYPASAPAELHLFGWVNEREERVEFGVSLPGMLSWLVTGDTERPVTGLRAFPPEDRPPVNVVFQTYHAMVAIGMILIALALLGACYWIRGTLWQTRWLLWIYVFAVGLPQLANQLGWISAEVGRQPWIVYGLLRTRDGISKVVGPERCSRRSSCSCSSTLCSSRSSSTCWTTKSGRARGRRNRVVGKGGAGMSFDLNTVWFILVGVLLTGYAILDGFDLGVGALHLFTSEGRGPADHAQRHRTGVGRQRSLAGDRRRGACLRLSPTCTPPSSPASTWPSCSCWCMLIFRAVAIEFRSKQPMGWWRQTWDVSFSVASIVSSLLLGVALGNIAWGVPLRRPTTSMPAPSWVC